LLNLSDLGNGAFGITTTTGSGLGNATYTQVTVTDVAATIIAANTARKSLLILNNSVVDEVYLNTATPAANAASLKLKPGASYSTSSTGNAFKAIAASGKSVSLTIEEIA
jgi:hypothetical protein